MKIAAAATAIAGLLVAAPAFAQTAEETVAYMVYGLRDGDVPWLNFSPATVKTTPDKAVYLTRADHEGTKSDIAVIVTKSGDCAYDFVYKSVDRGPSGVTQGTTKIRVDLAGMTDIVSYTTSDNSTMARIPGATATCESETVSGNYGYTCPTGTGEDFLNSVPEFRLREAAHYFADKFCPAKLRAF